MRKLFLFLKMTFYIIIGLIVLICLVGFLFIQFSPEFGGSPSDSDKERYSESGHYQDGKFENLVETNMDMKAGDMMETIMEFLKGGENRRPSKALPQFAADSSDIANYSGPTRLIWFGHSSFLLQIDGKTILIDPMLGQVPAPHPMLGGKRYNSELPIAIAQLPQIDAIIISHDHYDHLDYGSIQKLKSKTDQYFVPLGVGAHFQAWGVADEQIHELNWWDEIMFDQIKLAFTPSRHFSGRGLSDRFATMWGSWVIQGSEDNIFFSGDSGYGPHFKKIGDTYGPFDFAMMECGQYNEKWANIHMMPEQTAQAGLDVRAKVLMPIHWGAFTLAVHSWTDPIERVSKKAEELEIPLRVPRIGEVILIDKTPPILQKWWLE